MRESKLKEALIKSGAQIAQSDFSSDCTKTTQEYGTNKFVPRISRSLVSAKLIQQYDGKICGLNKFSLQDAYQGVSRDLISDSLITLRRRL